MDFFDFEWGKAGLEKAIRAKRSLEREDEAYVASIQGILIASVVTARGRRMSPSKILEALMNSKKRTNPTIVQELNEAWNVMHDQSISSSDRWDVMTSLITPKHRNKTGISETLKHQLALTHESLMDFWIVVADLVTGFRTVTTQVFGVKDTVGVGEYLLRGMTRSQLKAAFPEIPEAKDDASDESEET